MRHGSASGSPSGQRPTTLRRSIYCDRDRQLVLHHYPRGETQARHEHDHTQVSFLLSGQIEETIGRSLHERCVPSACVKIAGTEHANRWGDSGVLMLSLRLRDWDPSLVAQRHVNKWMSIDLAKLSAVARSAFSAGSDLSAVGDDLLGLIGLKVEPRGPVPPWLQRVREAMHDDSTLSAEDLARLAGVHRVHLSRCFNAFFEMPLSLYRRQLRLSRAIDGALQSGESLAQVAQLAGFSDQSHMNREIAAAFGTTPRALRWGFASIES